MGLDRSVVTNTINFSYLLFQNSILVMLFKHFCHPNPGSSLLKTKPNISILSGLSKSKAWKSPVLGLAPSPVFSSLPWPMTFPLILLSKSSVAYVVIKKKKKKLHMLQEFGKQRMDLSQFQSVVRRICHTYIIHVYDLLAVRNSWCLVRDLFPFHTESFWGQADIWGFFCMWIYMGG